MLRRNPGSSLVAVLALTLGIGANTAVFTVVNSVLLRSLPYPYADRLLLLSDRARDGRSGPVMRLSDRDYVEFRRRDRFFDALATFDANGVDMTGAGEPVHLLAGNVTADFMKVLGIRPVIGRTFTGDDERTSGDRTAVIGSSLWRERFGADPKVIGRKITLDGVDRTIIGVLPPEFAYPEGVRLWIPMEVRLDPHIAFLRPAVGRLKTGATRQQARAELESTLRPSRVAEVRPFQEFVVADVRAPLLIFAGAVGFVLLIGCANVANLLLIRMSSRRQEIAIRAAVGAGVWRLIRQLLSESALLSLIGGTMGLLLAMWGVPLLLTLAPEGTIPRASEIHLDGWALVFTFGVSLLTGILFGLAPASHVLWRPLRDSLAGSARIAGRTQVRLRSALMVSELVLALVLLAGAGVMVKSFLRMRAVDPGFRPDNVLTLVVSLPDSVYPTAAAKHDFEARLLDKLTALPGVTAAGAVDLRPMGEFMLNGNLVIDGGRPLPPNYLVDKPCVSPSYFRTMGIRLLAGRDFTARDDLAAPGVAIVSQSVARELWLGENPVGKRLSLEEPPTPKDWLTVVGVVEDVRQYGPTIEPGRGVYRPYTQTTGLTVNTEVTFAVRAASDPVPVASAMRRAVSDVDPTRPVKSLAAMQDRVSETIAPSLFQARVLTVFSLMALLLAAMGIYGVAGCAVAERTREIGIRMVLGATTGAVMREVLRRTMNLAAIGVALGSAGAFVATRVLSKLLFEVKPADPTTFTAVALLLAAVAILAGWIAARRATHVDPMVALRYE
jgi:putative ABC transport system permease protein